MSATIHRITPEAIEWVVAFLRNSPTNFEITPKKAWLMHCACAFGADPYETAAAIDDGRIQSSMDAENLLPWRRINSDLTETMQPDKYTTGNFNGVVEGEK